MSKQKSSAKALIITDDEQEDPNPFSFREFLRWKSLEPEPDVDLEPEPDLYPDPDLDLDQTHRQNRQLPQNQPGGAVRLSEPAVQNRSLEGVTFDPEVRSCFFSEPSLDPQEEEWGRSLQSGVDSTSSLCTEEEGEEETRFSSRPEAQQGAGAAESYEGDDETSMAEAVSTCRGRSLQQLQEENQCLRRSIRELQRSSQADQRRVEQLTEELLQRRRREEQEAQDLESMVHSVEQNLTQMTKRAVKAELCVSKLKWELQQLQVENEGLKAAESEVVMTMRQNAQVASDYLNKTASHAHSSIRQLLGGAETLSLVAQLLASIDRVSSEDSPG
ncbi:endosome-associated-trafficking regulator 1 isoform X2 [Gymnodraco acuticeps]|uniref:Endosome-associated-trafficking regulator 1 n=1 Tax=Gymnodraco acuticeps TaxID=8218 RepID=A0A6P8VY50_GYMAC|nr:endosome-associated-trafficking regulator 1 isoform X2 [Gymnodraco acuticeps]